VAVEQTDPIISSSIYFYKIARSFLEPHSNSNLLPTSWVFISNSTSIITTNSGTTLHIAIMPQPLLQVEADQKASGPSISPAPSLTPKRNPIYLRSFLRWAIGAAATSSNESLTLRVMKHDPILNTWTLIENSRLKKPGDLQVVVITEEEMNKMPDRWGGKITKDTTTRTGPSLAAFPGFGLPVPEFSEVMKNGMEVLAWRVFGSADKMFMDTDGFGLPGVSGMIQAWFERI
jgi:hypothetical protein